MADLTLRMMVQDGLMFGFADSKYIWGYTNRMRYERTFRKETDNRHNIQG